jgi:hypothetical protein
VDLIAANASSHASNTALKRERWQDGKPIAHRLRLVVETMGVFPLDDVQQVRAVHEARHRRQFLQGFSWFEKGDVCAH